MDQFKKSKISLRNHILANPEKVKEDLEHMRLMSKKSIEVAAGNLADPNICKTENWIAGANYQAEKMYTEEDVKNAFLDGWQLRDVDLPFPKAKKKWFEEFKKY